jgi:hypothetical protein
MKDNSLKQPKFQFEPALKKLDSTLIRGLIDYEIFDEVLCPPQTVVLAFGQKGTGYSDTMVQRLQEAQLGKCLFNHLNYWPAKGGSLLCREKHRLIVFGQVWYVLGLIKIISNILKMKSNLQFPVLFIDPLTHMYWYWKTLNM